MPHPVGVTLVTAAGTAGRAGRRGMKVAADAANLEEEVSIADLDMTGEVAVGAQTLRGGRPTRSLGRWRSVKRRW